MIKFLDVIHFSENENFLGIFVPVKGTNSSVVGEKVLICSPVTESSRTDRLPLCIQQWLMCECVGCDGYERFTEMKNGG